MPTITFIEESGRVRSVDAPLSKSVMEVAVAEMIPGIVGECGGCCSCATCHVYVEQGWYGRLPQPDSVENDILDGALGVKENSRLSCQIRVTPELDGLVLRVPPSDL